MEKINVAELLSNCPSGMELDCTMFEGVEFDGIVDNKYTPIRCRIKNPDGGYNVYFFTKHGYWNDDCKAKCVIFPKGKTTWEGFQRPFKDGDIIYNRLQKKICIYYLCEDEVPRIKGCRYNESNIQLQFEKLEYPIPIAMQDYRFATEEEKAKLFDSINVNGYKWNPETKTLEKLPKFKVGDKIVDIFRKQAGASGSQGVISEITDDKYIFTDGSYIYIRSQDNWELEKSVKPEFKVGDIIQDIDAYKVKITEINIGDECYGYESIIANGIGSIPFNEQGNWKLVRGKFDIDSLVPFESRVLARDNEREKWHPAFWGFYDANSDYPYKLVGCIARYCIPYEGNEHLRGKVGDCDKYFKTWE